MRCRGWASFCVSAGLLALSAAFAADEPSEQVTTAKLVPATPYRIYLSDFAINHVVDGRLYVIDSDALKLRGMVATGFAAGTALAPDRSELYVSTTYYPRLSRGERVDVVEIYDLATLELKGEIAIPPKHAQALGYRGLLRTSSDGRLLFVQNATPASSVTVVDLKARKVLSEVPIPGCWIILPSHSVAPRFSTLCGDGTVLTVTLDEAGKPTMKRSAKFFNPDVDPLFIHAENIGDRYFFVSFKGQVYAANLGGEMASFEEPWSLLTREDQKAGWRPGGYQISALHQASGRLFVAMHPKGGEGSHKNPAQQIWVFDLGAKKRIARAPGHNAVAIVLSRNEQPRLFALDGVKNGLAIYDADRKLVFKRRMEGVAEAGTLMETH